MSFSTRLKCPGAEEHAGNLALLFPLSYMPGKETHQHTSLQFILHNIFVSMGSKKMSLVHFRSI